MNNLETLQEILAKEVTRKQFLMHIGTALLAVVGIGSVMKNMQSILPQKNNELEGSYGYSGYSGSSEKQAII